MVGMRLRLLTYLGGLPAQVGHLATVKRPAHEVWSLSTGMTDGLDVVDGGSWRAVWFWHMRLCGYGGCYSRLMPDLLAGHEDY